MIIMYKDSTIFKIMNKIINTSKRGSGEGRTINRQSKTKYKKYKIQPLIWLRDEKSFFYLGLALVNH